MEFRTPVAIVQSSEKLTYEDAILTLGSCFAVNMAEKLKRFQFRCVSNPFGIIFNPISLERLVKYACANYRFTDKDVFCYQGVWSCFATHSEMNELEAEVIVEKLNHRRQMLTKALQISKHIMITLGTAWVYEREETGEIVANCHKLPQSHFRKRLLTVGEVSRSLERIVRCVKEINPDVKFVFSLSPVRHFKDGVVENQWSKAVLTVGLQDFLHHKSSEKISYFPSYEIVMDELRDYRFYKADLLHPNDIAVDYIWERFVETWIGPKEHLVMRKVEEVQRGLNHRSFNPYSESHARFLEQLAQKIDDLLERYPHMSFR